MKKYVFNDLFNHVKVTLVLAWRGLFVEKYFGLLGVIAMVWGLCGGLKREERALYLMISLPIGLMLLFHAFFTVSIPRYNLSLLLPMSLCMAMSGRC